MTAVVYYFKSIATRHVSIPNDEFAYRGLSAGPDDRGEGSKEHSLEVEVSQLVLRNKPGRGRARCKTEAERAAKETPNNAKHV